MTLKTAQLMRSTAMRTHSASFRWRRTPTPVRCERMLTRPLIAPNPTSRTPTLNTPQLPMAALRGHGTARPAVVSFRRTPPCRTAPYKPEVESGSYLRSKNINSSGTATTSTITYTVDGAAVSHRAVQFRIAQYIAAAGSQTGRGHDSLKKTIQTKHRRQSTMKFKHLRAAF